MRVKKSEMPALLFPVTGVDGSGSEAPNRIGVCAIASDAASARINDAHGAELKKAGLSPAFLVDFG